MTTFRVWLGALGALVLATPSFAADETFPRRYAPNGRDRGRFVSNATRFSSVRPLPT